MKDIPLYNHAYHFLSLIVNDDQFKKSNEYQYWAKSILNPIELTSFPKVTYMLHFNQLTEYNGVYDKHKIVISRSTSPYDVLLDVTLRALIKDQQFIDILARMWDVYSIYKQKTAIWQSKC